MILKKATKLSIAKKTHALQNEGKEKRAAEPAIANEELSFQSDEKDKRTAELVIADKDVLFQNAEKGKLAPELAIASKELRTILENSGIGLILLDEHCNILEINNIASQLSELAVGIKFKKFDNFYFTVPEWRKEDFKKHYSKVLNGESLHYKSVHPQPGGTKLFLNVNFVPAKNYDGNVLGACLSMEDITARKNSEEKLIESELRYRTIIDQATYAICITDTSWKFIDANPYALEIFGYTKEEALQKSLPDILFEEDLIANPFKLEEIKSGIIVRRERRLKRKDGTAIEMEVSTRMTEDGRLLMFGHDISERKNEELQKRLLEEIILLFNEPVTLDEILQSAMQKLVSTDNFCKAEAWLVDKYQQNINRVARFLDDDLLPFFQNENNHKQSLAKGEELAGLAWQTQTIQCLQHSPNENNFKSNVADKNPGKSTTYALPIIFNNEVLGVLVLCKYKGERIEKELPILFKNWGILIGNSIRRKQVEQELSQLFNFAPDIITVAGMDGVIRKINPAATTLFGYSEEEFVNSSFINYIHPDDKEKAITSLAALRDKIETVDLEMRCITRQGKIAWLLWTITSSPVEGLLYAVAKEITEKKELENLLNKTNALAGIGSWEADLVKRTLFWSNITREIHEAANSFVPDFVTGLNFYKEGENRDLMAKNISDAIEFGKPWDEEIIIVTAKNNERWVRVIGETEFVNGKCLRFYGSFQNIDERKRTEIELRNTIKSLDDYRYALNESSILAITNPKGVITFVNDNFCKISKYSREELIGKKHQVINSGYHPRAFFKDMWSDIGKGKVWKGEVKNMAKNGEYYWVDTTIVPFLDEKHKPLQYLAIRNDITKKKEAQEAARIVSRERTNILESIDDAFFAVDKNWIVTYWNRRAEKMLNKEKRTILGLNLWNVFSYKEGSIAYEKYHEALRKKRVVHFEEFRDDLDKWFDTTVYPSESGLSVYCKDISDQKKDAEKILKLNRRYLLISRINEMIIKSSNEETLFREACRIAVDHGGFKMVWVGKIDENTMNVIPVMQAGDHSGYLSAIKAISVNDVTAGQGPTGTAIRKRKYSFCNDIENDPCMAPWKEDALDREYRSCISFPILKFGKVIGAYTFYAPVKNFFDKDEIELLEEATNNVAFALEIIEKEKIRKKTRTEIVKLNVELESKVLKRTEELEASNREMEAFTYSVSHDLRAPLRGIIGFSAMLEEDYSSKMDEEAKRITSVIKNNTLRMGNLIDDLLGFSRIGRQQIVKTNINTTELVRDVIEELNQKGVGFPVEWILSALPIAKADIATLRQVWINLISNAIKYSGKNEHPKIEIGSEEKGNEIIFFVKDNGAGFDEKYKDKLFKVFQRLHSTSEFEGTGVGLAIVEKIIAKHGGKVWATGAPGKGATFYFTLPAA